VSDVVVYHHSLGLTEGVRRFADGLRAGGHTVHTPDLYDGRTFETIEEGMAHAEELGFPTAILERGRAAAESLPADVYYVGFSLGAMPAQSLAQTRPGARGAVLAYGALALGEWGESWPAEWPEGVALQLHSTEGDEDVEIMQGLAATVPGAELFLYPGPDHLFAERDDNQRELLVQRVLDFLSAGPGAS
jgi:dienelactone hydrolase